MLKIVNTSLLFILLVVVLIGCKSSPAQNEPQTATEPVAERITLRKDTLEARFTIPGELIAYQQVDLYAKVTGFVKDMNVDIGSNVKTGQILITLEAPELMSQLSASQSKLKSQEALYTASLANYNRLVETSKTPGTISQNDLDQAEARKNSDLANLEAARASYKEVNDVRNYLVMRAPFDGKITARNINIGTYVGPSGKGSELPALVLQQQSKLRLVISVPEGYSGYMKQGDEVTFKVRSIPSETFNAKLTRLSGALDVRLRSQRAEADIDNKDGKFIAGTIADVSTVLRSSPKAFVVPKTAVVVSAEAVFVIKVVDNKAVRLSVKKGLDANGQLEVFGDLAVGDVLLAKASDEIKTGQEFHSPNR